jgi:alcohol dehydrogenase (NADP+)
MKTTNNTINMPALGFGTLITKLWNTNHRPERVAPAFEASLKRLRLDYLDCYLMHTPFAFQPGDEQDPRD